MTLNWYQCKNCGTAIKQDINPSNLDVLQKLFTLGQNWQKLATLTTVAKSAERLSKRKEILQIQVVRV